MAGNEFLDKAGLVVLWDRIKQLVYECCCGNKDYECINDEVVTSECFEKAVLSVTGGKGGDCGFSCDTRISTLYEGSVVVRRDNSNNAKASTKSAEDTPTPSSFIKATIPYYGKPVDALRITLNGTTYICEAITRSGATGYSDSMSKPTFAVICSQGKESGTYDWILGVMSEGTYALKLEDYYDKIETTECFDKAVQSVIGYSCTDTNQPIYSGSIATLDGDPAFSDPIILDELSSIPPSLWVSFNSPTPNFIEVEGVSSGNEYAYGASLDETTDTWDFSTYPFAIILKMLELGGVGMMLVTEEADSYLLDLMAALPTATVNDCFKAAVNEAVDIDVSPSLGYIPVYYDSSNQSFYSTMSFDEMVDMYTSNRLYAVQAKNTPSSVNYSVFPLVNGSVDVTPKASASTKVASSNYLRFQQTEVVDNDYVVTIEFYIDLHDEVINRYQYKYPNSGDTV